MGDGESMEHSRSLSAASSAQRLLRNSLAQHKFNIIYEAGQRSQLSGMSLELFSGLGLECSLNATNATLVPSNHS